MAPKKRRSKARRSQVKEVTALTALPPLPEFVLTHTFRSSFLLESSIAQDVHYVFLDSVIDAFNKGLASIFNLGRVHWCNVYIWSLTKGTSLAVGLQTVLADGDTSNVDVSAILSLGNSAIVPSAAFCKLHWRAPPATLRPTTGHNTPDQLFKIISSPLDGTSAIHARTVVDMRVSLYR